MSAYSIYHAVFTHRYEPDPQAPTTPALIDAPRDDSGRGIWAVGKPTMWLESGDILAVAELGGQGLAAGPYRRFAETLTLNALQTCTTDGWLETEFALRDRMLQEMAFIAAEPPDGIAAATIVGCGFNRILIEGKGKVGGKPSETPAVRAALTWGAELVVKDEGFQLRGSNVPEDFRPTMVELHNIPAMTFKTFDLP